VPRGTGSAPSGQVAIDARAAVRSQIGGVERLAREMAARLPALRPDRYRVIAPPARLAHRAGHVWEQLVLPARAVRCGLIYCPANLAPLISPSTVLVLHDAAAFRHPDAYSRAYVTYQRRLLPALAHRARLLVTVSEFSRTELADVLGLDAGRIAVVPEGVDDVFTTTDEEAIRSARTRYGLDRPYVLTVGTASVRKNLGLLGPAARALSEHGIEIVLAGSDRGYLRAGHVPVRRLGYVAEEHLPGLYAGALALAMPSRYEGFGLPCLEAMAAGTPVIAARCGALPETVGDAGLLVEGDDAEAFAVALLATVTSPDERERLAVAGSRRAAEFSWRRTAELTDRAIDRLLDPTIDRCSTPPSTAHLTPPHRSRPGRV
jgi:glycosyltransferase involved in cell wall biosynthesis